MRGKFEISTRVVDDTAFHPAFDPEEARQFNSPNQEAIFGDHKLVLLGRGNHYSLPENCPPMQGEDELKASGFAVSAKAICILDLSPNYSLILFDRGTDKQGVDEPLIALTPLADNITVSDRFFMIDKTAYMQIGISAGSGQGRKQLNGYMEFCAGTTIYLGRIYAEELGHETLPSEVSAKHAAIDCLFDGQMTVYDCLSTNATAITHRV